MTPTYRLRRIHAAAISVQTQLRSTDHGVSKEINSAAPKTRVNLFFDTVTAFDVEYVNEYLSSRLTSNTDRNLLRYPSVVPAVGYKNTICHPKLPDIFRFAAYAVLYT